MFQISQDTDPLPKRSTQPSDQSHIGKQYVALGAITLLSLPLLAHAGGLSLFNTTITYDRTDAIRKDVGANSQTMSLLQPAVHVDPNPAKGGADIEVLDDTALLASGSVSGETVDVEPVKRSGGQISVYEVREGDTLSQIATMFNVSINTIKWSNDIKGSISPGQTLVILPISGIEYTVKKGDTIAGIAKKYKAHADEIRDFNELGTELVVGAKIIIPDAEISEPAPQVAKKSSGASSGGGSAPAVSGGSWLKWPVAGGVKTQGIHGYNAVDIGAPAGTPVYAAAGGTVLISRSGAWNGGYGNYVVIKHSNGVQTLYAHHSRNAVTTGQWVNQGDVIGYVGSTGKSTGNHLHFEVRGGSNPF